jgi:hypothetical protein
MKKNLYQRYYKIIDALPEPMRRVYLAALLTAEFSEKWNSEGDENLLRN